MLVTVVVRKIIPIELLDISGVVVGMGSLDKTIKIDLATFNTLSDFACKAHLKSNDSFKLMKTLVPVINNVLKPIRLAIMQDSCNCNEIPADLLEDSPVFYRLDLRRGL